MKVYGEVKVLRSTKIKKSELRTKVHPAVSGKARCMKDHSRAFIALTDLSLVTRINYNFRCEPPEGSKDSN